MDTFQKALLSAIDTAANDLNVRQMRLRQNIVTYGAVAAVKDYFKRSRCSDGFDELCRLGHSELTMEAIVTKHHALFTDDEVNFCFSLLCAVDHYKI